MAQSNLAREPSMDEILASIRRIIESNDAVGPGLPANDTGSVSLAVEQPYSDEDMEQIELTIDEEMLAAEFEAEQAARVDAAARLQARTAEPAPTAQSRKTASEPAAAATAPSAIAPPPVSLADVAARVRAASERQPFRQEPTKEAAPASGPAAPSAAAASSAPASVPEVEAGGRAGRAEARSGHETLGRHPLLSDAVTGVPSMTETQAETAVPAPAGNTPASAEPTLAPSVSPILDRQAPAILSAAVGEQVSRAFGELALAVESGPRRSFDEIAEDMLRPMLQEWLDDNLPTLVERLVREEIERVARGPRR